ncbi:MAG: DUF3794 domain-containing protein [Clostridia bacterium]|nr:DUF3794 domain-containing protein [Clostridia bacterium]
MNTNEQNTAGRLTMPIIRRDINSDVSEDFTLPDYYPEIRKVLYARESLLAPAKFVSGNKIDVSGVIDYDLVYVSADGRLCSAPFSAEYSFSLPLENMSCFELSEGFSVIAHTVADSSSVRVSAPRRLQIRSHLCTSVGVWGKVLCGEKVFGLEADESFERLEDSFCATELVCESSDVISVQDEYRLAFADGRVALAQSSVVISNVRIDDDVAKVNGEILIKLLEISDTTGEIERIQRKIPFDAETDLDGIDMSEKPLCRVSGRVTDLSVEVEEGIVLIEANLVLELCGVSERTAMYTRDAYSTEKACECEMRSYEIPRVLCNKNASISQGERITLEESGIPEDSEIVDVCATAVAKKAEQTENGYTITGNCRYNVILLRDGEYSSAEMNIPFRYDTDALDTANGEVESYDIVASVSNARGRRDGDYIDLGSEISLACSIWGKESIEMLERADFGEPIEKRSGAIIVCFPSGDDTLWSIAKRYCVGQGDVSGDPTNDSFVMIET